MARPGQLVDRVIAGTDPHGIRRLREFQRRQVGRAVGRSEDNRPVVDQRHVVDLQNLAGGVAELHVERRRAGGECIGMPARATGDIVRQLGAGGGRADPQAYFVARRPQHPEPEHMLLRYRRDGDRLFGMGRVAAAAGGKAEPPVRRVMGDRAGAGRPVVPARDIRREIAVDDDGVRRRGIDTSAVPEEPERAVPRFQHIGLGGGKLERQQARLCVVIAGFGDEHRAGPSGCAALGQRDHVFQGSAAQRIFREIGPRDHARSKLARIQRGLQGRCSGHGVSCRMIERV